MTRRPRPPLLLPGPTRLATIARTPALLVLAALALVTILMLSGPAPEWPAPAMTRIAFDHALVERLRHGGEDYYTATTATLRGHDLPLTPVTAFPLPALPVAAAAMPAPFRVLLLGLLTVATMLVWSARLTPQPAGRPLASLAALAGGGGWIAFPALAAHPAMWAGLLVSLAIGLLRPRRWIEPVALGTCAALLDGAAGLFLLIMAVIAWREGSRREAAGWCAGLLVAAMAFLCHALAAQAAARSFDGTVPGQPPAGLAEALYAVGAGGGLAIAPAGVAVTLVVLAALGWTVWRSPWAMRVGGTLIAYILLVALLPVGALPIALIVAPVALLGLVPAAEALRDLFAAALDSRRITVTRVVR